MTLETLSERHNVVHHREKCLSDNALRYANNDLNDIIYYDAQNNDLMT